jgi:hypothetical protein
MDGNAIVHIGSTWLCAANENLWLMAGPKKQAAHAIEVIAEAPLIRLLGNKLRSQEGYSHEAIAGKRFVSRRLR